MNRRQTTTAIKRALRDAGFTGARARNQTGTAWGWIRVVVDRDHERYTFRGQYSVVKAIAADAAGRGEWAGDYGAQINVSINQE